METPIVLSACRTPIGKFGGALATASATQFGAVAVKAAIARAGLSPEEVDEVIMGNVLSAGIGQAPARQAALQAGLPPRVAAVTVNKVCGSGLKAIMLAAQAIRCGDANVVVAGGMESMSQSPRLLSRSELKLGDRTLIDSMLNDGLRCGFSGKSMGQIAETLARVEGITRDQQDQFACQSHHRAADAMEHGKFEAETISVTSRKGSDEFTVERDEGPRGNTSVEKLAGLSPAFEDGGTVTAGNASMISDGASALVIASESFVQAHALQPMARIVAFVTVGTAPEDLFIAPVAAVQKVLDRCGMTTSDIDLYEINEAFAVQMLACQRRLDLPDERLNVHGGAIALGHPIGASGARVATTLLHALRQRDGHLGVAAFCLGGGNAVAAVFE